VGLYANKKREGCLEAQSANWKRAQAVLSGRALIQGREFNCFL
jgi:hypothetical protein